MITKTCDRCTNSFETAYETQLYCSGVCKKAAKHTRRYGTAVPVRRTWELGRRFGRLVLVKRVEKPGRQYWLCDCDCGNTEVLCRADKLHDGRVKSCGCLRDETIAETKARADEKRREIKEAEIRQLTEKQEALARLRDGWTPAGYEQRWSGSIGKKHDSVKSLLYYSHASDTDPLWSQSYYQAILAGGCHYCHSDLDNDRHSLDMRDDLKGLTAANVLPACESCLIKRRSVPNPLSVEEMETVGVSLEIVWRSRAA